MADLPTGTVTFLFTDIEGSTRLWEEHPSGMGDALSRHDAIVRGAVESHGGQVVKGTGDGGFAVFGAVGEALGAAVALQRAMAEEPWATTGPLRLRIGVHTGEAQSRDNDDFGPVLNRTARLMGVAHGGQIVCSQATADLARDDPEEARALVQESTHLRTSLGLESSADFTQAALVSARLGDRPQTLTVAAPAIRHLHWTGNSPVLGAVLNLVAGALASSLPEAAAKLQGAARTLASAAAKSPAAPSRTDGGGDPAAGSAARTDFVTELRRATTTMLRDTLGDARLGELRQEGELLDRDQAVVYALGTINEAARLDSVNSNDGEHLTIRRSSLPDVQDNDRMPSERLSEGRNTADQVPVYGGTLRSDRMELHGDDDVSDLLLRLHVRVRLYDLLKRVGAIEDRRELP